VGDIISTSIRHTIEERNDSMVSVSGSIAPSFGKRLNPVPGSMNVTEETSARSPEDAGKENEAAVTEDESNGVDHEDTAEIKRSVFAAGDINGDKRPELIEQKPNGKLTAYYFSKDLHNESKTVLLPGELGNSGLVLKGTYTSESEKKVFLLFQHKDTGAVMRIELKDDKLGEPESLDIDAKDWNIVALHDFPEMWDKNKKVTIVGQNKEGRLHWWVMDGMKIDRDEDYPEESNPAPGWNIAGAGNFHTEKNRFLHDTIDDGTSDIMGHAEGCDLVSQYIDALGSTHQKISLYDYNYFRGEKMLPPDQSYEEDYIVAIADMNGDKKSDIIRQKEDKSIEVMFMNEAHQKYSHTLLEDWQMDEDK
jgi:hypothetical protein